MTDTLPDFDETAASDACVTLEALRRRGWSNRAMAGLRHAGHPGIFRAEDVAAHEPLAAAVIEEYGPYQGNLIADERKALATKLAGAKKASKHTKAQQRAEHRRQVAERAETRRIEEARKTAEAAAAVEAARAALADDPANVIATAELGTRGWTLARITINLACVPNRPGVFLLSEVEPIEPRVLAEVEARRAKKAATAAALTAKQNANGHSESELNHPGSHGGSVVWFPGHLAS